MRTDKEMAQALRKKAEDYAKRSVANVKIDLSEPHTVKKMLVRAYLAGYRRAEDSRPMFWLP